MYCTPGGECWTPLMTIQEFSGMFRMLQANTWMQAERWIHQTYATEKVISRVM